MIRNISLLFCAFVSVYGETYTLTLRQAVDLALQQNPDLIVSRLDEQKATQSIRLARDPFYPRLLLGSGAAYSSGYPLTIDGNPPSIFQAHAVQTFFNRSKTYAVAEARENERTTLMDIDIKRDTIVFQTASMYLDAERSTQVSDIASRQVAQYEQISQTVAEQTAEGRKLDIESDKARLNLARAKQRANQMDLDRSYFERSLAIVLGYGPEDVVKISTSERHSPDLPASEQEAVDQALSNSKELKRLESMLIAKGYTVKAQHATRLPQVDLVAQYALLTRYNFDFFSSARFSRNAGQLGISVQVPLLSGTGASALAQQAEIESIRLREEVKSARGRISLDARRSFEELRNVQAAEEVARLDLEVTRKQLSITLAQFGEGRATLSDLADLRLAENEKWITFYEAQSTRERARLNVLKQTGSLLSSLR
jgi:outer membrane protein TolC